LQVHKVGIHQLDQYCAKELVETLFLRKQRMDEQRALSESTYKLSLSKNELSSVNQRLIVTESR